MGHHKLTDEEKEKMETFEGLDYDVVENAYHQEGALESSSPPAEAEARGRRSLLVQSGKRPALARRCGRTLVSRMRPSRSATPLARA